RQSQCGKQINAEEYLEMIVPVHHQWQQQRDHQPGQRQDHLPALHDRCLPKIPLGRSESTSRKITKSTASAHSFPQYRLVRLSTTPSSRPAIAAPTMDSIPPSTTITNAFSVNCPPTSGYK